MPTGKQPTQRILAKPPGSESNTLEVGAIWTTSNNEVTSVVFKREALSQLLQAEGDPRGIIVPNRPKAANNNAPKKAPKNKVA